MAHVYFDSSYCPCGFLIVREGASPYDESQTVLVQSDWDYPGVASSMGWEPCSCGATDGTVDCQRCGRKASDMIAEAYDWIESREGEEFDSLDDYFPEE
jgi:hypothetical protein